MCGRFIALTPEELRDVAAALDHRTAMRQLTEDRNRGLAFPGSVVGVLEHGEGGIALDELLWGFSGGEGKRTVFNTRIESALTGSPMWRDAIRNGRCVIPAASFFEPHHTEKATSPKTGRPVKRPYSFQSADRLPLLMAGVSAGDRCSIVTCEPNRWVSPIHPRMPLVLRFEEVPLWLNADIRDLAALANRDGIELTSRPELEGTRPEPAEQPPDQLSLF